MQENFTDIEKPSTSKQCAFQMMRDVSSDRSVLPEPENPTDSKKKLKNELRKFLENNELGWSKDGCAVPGPMFINTLSECFWYIERQGMCCSWSYVY